jgi:hypothetical protein
MAEIGRKTICLMKGNCHVPRILWELNVILGAKDGVAGRLEGDKCRKVQVELDTSKLDIGLAALVRSTNMDWKENRRVCRSHSINNLSCRIIMIQQDREMCKVAQLRLR